MSENMTTTVPKAAVDGESTVLSVRDARVTFDMSRGVSRVLDDISLDVQRDEILGVVGESGSGKSMLANAMLNSVVEPGELSGEVIYRPEGGQPVDITELSAQELKHLRWEELSMVFQGAMSSFNPTMKIRAHFEETLESHGHDLDEGMERTKRLLGDVFLEADRVLDLYPHELSGGMKQRALIALALVLEPEVLVMDEPTASLDLLMQRSIISLLESLKEEYDLTLVFITHDLPLVTRLSDRIAVMYAFDLAELGRTEQILRNPSHPYTRKLLKTTPNLDKGISSIETIAGSSPDPVNTPSGCAFHPRCPLADDRCHRDDPTLTSVSGDGEHGAACHYWERAGEEIPFDISEAHEDDIEIGSTAKRLPPEQASDSGTDAASEDPLVSLDDLHIEFEKEGGILDIFNENDVVQAVSGVDLDIYENDVVAIVGESGCGKTTLGKAAIGLHRPADGSISYRGQDIWAARDGEDSVDIPFEEIRKSLQIIHQDPGSALNQNKRVLSSLERPLKRWNPGMDRNDRESRIYTLLEEVGMTPPTDYAQRYPHQLSGGEKQRVALIRALLMNPDLILGDEAISALDVSLRVEMMDLFLELQETFDTSFLFISHDLANANYLAQHADGRIAVMYLGEIVEVGPVEQIIHNPQHPYTQILRWATPDLDPDQEEATDVPIRNIDIPDPEDPPSGCRFHTRCPEAREACKQMDPQAYSVGEEHEVSCFRILEEHEYWDSEPVGEDES